MAVDDAGWEGMMAEVIIEIKVLHGGKQLGQYNMAVDEIHVGKIWECVNYADGWLRDLVAEYLGDQP